MPLGGNLPLMGASLPASASGPCPTQVAPDPTMAMTVAAPEPAPPVLRAPTSPSPLETSLPALEGLEDIDEMEEVAVEGQ